MGSLFMYREGLLHLCAGKPIVVAVILRVRLLAEATERRLEVPIVIGSEASLAVLITANYNTHLKH
ncbi:MAG: hypothetical protein RH948_01715 [Cyclobacteriaceae bacterium]